MFARGLHNFFLFFVKIHKFFESIFIAIFAYPIEMYIRSQFKKADIEIGTKRGAKWDIKLNGDGKEFFKIFAQKMSIGFGESYMRGLWDCDDLEELIYRIVNSELGSKKMQNFAFNGIVNYFYWDLFNLQKIGFDGAKKFGIKQYDQGDGLYESFMGPTMNFSCGYWKDASNLDEAQINKMKLIAEKLKLQPGMRILDIGCGWGGLSKFLAENYDVFVVGVTISEYGAKMSRKNCEGLAVEIRHTDLKLMAGDEKFDRIVAVQVLEHVGLKNYEEFFQLTKKWLTEDGLFLLHVLGVNDSKTQLFDPWISTYIMPNMKFPTLEHIVKYTNDKFIVEDLHNIGGHDFHLSCMAWYRNFIDNWPTIENTTNRDQMFFRMWSLYLLMSAGSFRTRKYQVWQFVFSKTGFEGGYQSIR